MFLVFDNFEWSLTIVKKKIWSQRIVVVYLDISLGKSSRTQLSRSVADQNSTDEEEEAEEPPTTRMPEDQLETFET